MKKPLSILAAGLAALCLPLQTWAQETPRPLAAKAAFGPKAKWDSLTDEKVTDAQGDIIGRVRDATVDLSNGRIVEMLVVSDQTLRTGGRTVAVPPEILISNPKSDGYQINVSAETFMGAPEFDVSKWAESTRTDHVAAAYKYFGEIPAFLVTDKADRTTTASGRTVVSPGSFERMSKLLKVPVQNLQGQSLGIVDSVILDVPTGRILNVYIESPGAGANNTAPVNETTTVIPPTMLNFNAAHDTLLLDLSTVAYGKEPHVIFQTGAGGQEISDREEAATGPHTDVALVQGATSYDINTTAEIRQSIKKNNLDPAGKVEVGTKDGRVTLRGSVGSQAAKDSIGAIAIAAVNLDNVDNQIEVVPPLQAGL